MESPKPHAEPCEEGNKGHSTKSDRPGWYYLAGKLNQDSSWFVIGERTFKTSVAALCCKNHTLAAGQTPDTPKLGAQARFDSQSFWCVDAKTNHTACVTGR